MTSHPRYAYVTGKGKCQVLGYYGNGYFFLLTARDERIFKHRESFVFVSSPDHATRPDAPAH